MKLTPKITLTALEWFALEHLAKVHCPPDDCEIAITRTESRKHQAALEREAFDILRDALHALQWHRRKLYDREKNMTLVDIRLAEHSEGTTERKERARRETVEAVLSGEKTPDLCEPQRKSEPSERRRCAVRSCKLDYGHDNHVHVIRRSPGVGKSSRAARAAKKAGSK